MVPRSAISVTVVTNLMPTKPLVWLVLLENSLLPLVTAKLVLSMNSPLISQLANVICVVLVRK